MLVFCLVDQRAEWLAASMAEMSDGRMAVSMAERSAYASVAMSGG